MVGYTALGSSDVQFYPASPEEVWTSLKAHLGTRNGVIVRSLNDDLRRIEVNLGLGNLTGNCIASLAVDPAPGGASLRFSGRMGSISSTLTLNLGGQRRIETERTKIFDGVMTWLDDDEEPESSSIEAMPKQDGIAEQLTQLAALHAQGVLTDDEFTAAKGRLLA
jgi:hypothetical protein